MPTDNPSREVPLIECPIGLFWFGDTLAVKTEYGNNEGRIDAYIVSSGEFFCGPAPQSIASQRATMVIPVDTDFAEQALTASPAPVESGEERVRRSIERCPVATNQCAENECRNGCSISVPDPLTKPIESAADGPLLDRIDDIIRMTPPKLGDGGYVFTYAQAVDMVERALSLRPPVLRDDKCDLGPQVQGEEGLVEQGYSDHYDAFRNKWIGDHEEMIADLVRDFVPRAALASRPTPADEGTLPRWWVKRDPANIAGGKGGAVVQPFRDDEEMARVIRLLERPTPAEMPDVKGLCERLREGLAEAFITCVAGGGEPCKVVLQCKDLTTAQTLHGNIIDFIRKGAA